ncbi:small subunit processome component 20 homolog [Photinus pyralis]|uniref:small subunit processome component 20 homolog n=1 Tax=Photinus pyralis TaxID=7054 RepID=UPI001266E865|nr:small subunit processome component 20 homolog [Photinus pyralis]
MKNKPLRHKESNTFKFQPFAERIANINIDIFHRIGHENEEPDEEHSCLLYQSIVKWDTLNLSDPYNQFRREIGPHNLITLPQLIHKKDHVAATLLKHLRLKNILSIQALLEIVVAFVNDLRQDFYPYYPDFLRVIIDLLNTKETEQLEWTFTCLAYLFKFLWRPLVKEVKTVFGSLLPLLSDARPDYINDFAAQSFAFVVRKVKDWPSFLGTLVKVVRSTGQASEGCGKLLFEVIYGVNGQFHSCADAILPFLIQSLESDKFPRETLFEIVEEVVTNICARIKAPKSEPFWKACIGNIERLLEAPPSDESIGYIECNLKLLGQAVECKGGKLLVAPLPLVDVIVKLLSAGELPERLLLLVSQISVLILLSETITLPQEYAGTLTRKILSKSKIVLHFVDLIKGYSAFEHLILPTFLERAIAGGLTADFLHVLTRVVLHKSPPCQGGLRLASWVKYPIELGECTGKVVDLLSLDPFQEADSYLCALICLPHLSGVSVSEILAAKVRLLCERFASSPDPKTSFLLMATVECAVHLSPPEVVEWLDLILETLLTSCTKPKFVIALKTLDLYLTAISDSDRITFDLLLTVHKALVGNFSSPYHEMRLYTAHVYTLFARLPELLTSESDAEWRVFHLCYNVETITPQIQTYRDQLHDLELLSFGKPQMEMCNATAFRTLPLRYLCGVLYMNFRLLWEPTINIIATHAQGMELNEFWEVFAGELKLAAANVNDPLPCDELQLDCAFLHELYRSACRFETKPGFVNYRLLLWKALAGFPEVAERKSRDVSELFLKFIEEEYIKNNGEIAAKWNIKENKTDESVQEDAPIKDATFKLKGQSKLKLLLHHLAIFARVRNPMGMYREPELFKVYNDLLPHKHHEVQKLAMDCIMTYKNKSLTPYREHLYNLINEKNVKEELATFRVDTDSSVVQAEHREHLIPVVLNIVYSKMFAKTGMRTGGKSSGQLRRNLVLRFLAGCEKSEMFSFMRMTFRFYAKLLEDDLANVTRNVDLENVIPPKRLQSTLNLLGIAFEHFGGLGGDELLAFLLKVLFAIGAILRGIFEQIGNVHAGYSAVLRNLRVSSIKIVARFFEHFETYHWTTAEINNVFAVFVWPYLDKLTVEGIHSPTALLKLFLQWGANPRYFPLLVKHQHDNQAQTVLPHVAALLVNKNSHVTVRNAIMEMFEKLLSLESETEEALAVDDLLSVEARADVNYGSRITLPHIPALLDVIKRKLSAKFKKISEREITILSRVSELIREPEICDEVLTLLLPLTLTKCNETEELLVKHLSTISNLLRTVSQPERHLQQLAPLFAFVSQPACRKILCATLSGMPNLDLVEQLNAWDEQLVDQPNFERRLAGFKAARQLVADDKVDVTLGVFLVYTCWYLISNESDLSLKESASHCWKSVSVALIRKYEKSERFGYIMNDVLFDLIRRGLRSKSNDACDECISLLGHLARECPDSNVVLRDFKKLTCSEDIEVDFFENLVHLQVHRRERALFKFCQVFRAERNVAHSRTLTQFVLPIISIYLCQAKYAGNSKIVKAAIGVLKTTCRLLPWHQYEGVLRFYLKKLHGDFVYQDQLVKSTVAILEAFHFDLSKGLVTPVKASDAQETDTVAKQDGQLLEEGSDDEIDQLLNTEATDEAEVIKPADNLHVLSHSSATKVIRTIQLVLLPQLHKAFSEMTKHDKMHKVNRKKLSVEKEEEDISRIPISLAVVKLLQQLPREILEANVPRIFLKLSTFLKSRHYNVRCAARETLQKIMTNLGPKYLGSLLNEMSSILCRGYQIHVLIATVNSILVLLNGRYQPTDIDAVLLTVIDICKNELFGDIAKEKEVNQIGAKVPEAKTISGYNTFQILAQNITERCFMDLILSLREILATSQSFKVVNKSRECFRCISLGLVENTFITTESLLKFAYGTASESIPGLLASTAKPKPEAKERDLLEKPKGDCFIIPAAPVSRSAHFRAKTSTKSNAHVLVEFGLSLCNLLLTKERCKGHEFEPFLDPFVPVFKNCLQSRHVKLSTLTLQCLHRIFHYDLPSVRENIAEITEIIFEILHKYASAGLGKGDNFDLVLAAFKAMAVVVRDVKYHKIANSQLKTLLLYVEQDLNNNDRQAIAFTLLKAILHRKMMAAEMHAVMRQVSELSVTSELHHVRVQARSVFNQFIMNYPLKKKVDSHIAFYVSQTKYPIQSGRESAIEMIQTFINNFPIPVLVQYSGTFLVTLGAQMVNEEVSECRKMIASCLTDMFKRLPRPDSDSLFDMILVWLEDDKILHRQLAAQVCGLLVTIEKSTFQTRLPALLPVLLRQFERNQSQPGQYVLLKTAEPKDQEKDHHLFQVYQMLLKICSCCPSFLHETKTVQILSEYSQNLLSYPHEWVRLGAAQFLGFTLASLDAAHLSRLLLSKETEEGYLYSAPASGLKSLTLDLCAQLDPSHAKTELAEQVIKNLLFVARVLQSAPKQSEEKTVNLLWLVKCLRRTINAEIIKTPANVTLRTAVFKWIAAVVSVLEDDAVSSVAHHLLAPLAREMRTADTDAALKQLAKEVSTMLKNKLGIETYTSILAAIEQSADVRKAERKRERAQLAVTDPEQFAQKKIKLNEKKKESKKRKMIFMKGKGVKVKKRKVVEFDDFELI